MKRVVEVQIRSKYGRDLIYPVNETARLFARLVGRVTLLKADLTLIQDLGFKIEWVPQSVDLSGANDE